MDIGVIGSVKSENNFSSFFYRYPFHCGEQCQIPSPPSDMHPSRYFSCDNQAMIPQRLVHSSGKNASRHFAHTPMDMEGVVTDNTTTPNDGTFEATIRAVGVDNIDFVHYRYQDSFLKINQISDTSWQEHFPSLPSTWETISRCPKMLCRKPLGFSMKLSL